MKVHSSLALRLSAAVGIATVAAGAATLVLLPGRAPAGPEHGSAGTKTILLLDGYVQSRLPPQADLTRSARPSMLRPRPSARL